MEPYVSFMKILKFFLTFLKSTKNSEEKFWNFLQSILIKFQK
jgi:hypothetical protein